MKSNRIIHATKLLIAVLIACVTTLLLATTAYAIDLPDDTPTVEEINVYLENI